MPSGVFGPGPTGPPRCIHRLLKSQKKKPNIKKKKKQDLCWKQIALKYEKNK